MKKSSLMIILLFLTLTNCGLFQKNNDSAKNGLLALLGIAVFQGTGAGGDTPTYGASYTAWGTTSCANGWTVAYAGYMQMPHMRTVNVTVALSNLVCSATTLSTRSYAQSLFYYKPSNANYQPSGELMMSQFDDNNQNCALCVK
jgi:hypothetical protein